MGELVNLDEYRLRQKEIAEEKEREREQRELDQTIEEMEMLKRILGDLMKDLPDVKPSIMYIPIEPKMDAFMSKDVDGYLDKLGLKIDEGPLDSFWDIPNLDLDIEGFKDWKQSTGAPSSTPEIDDAFAQLCGERDDDETDET
jgi:hypothetical protein